MTLAEIAAARGLDLRTIERDCRSIADSFRAGGIDLATLSAADMKFVAAVIVYTLQEKCRVAPDSLEDVSHAPRVDSPHEPVGGSSRRRAGLPRRFRSKP